MLRYSTDGCSTFGLELCVCSRCKALLTRYDFVTDFLGRTVERCPSCGPRLVELHVGAVLGRHSRVFKPQLIGKCADCPKRMTWRGTGERPLRCKECQRKRARVRDLKRYHARQTQRHRLHV